MCCKQLRHPIKLPRTLLLHQWDIPSWVSAGGRAPTDPLILGIRVNKTQISDKI
jgi:hypothetical protein